MNLKSFYNKFKIKDILYFVLILPISITLISNDAFADKLKKSNAVIQEMINKAKVNAIETSKSDKTERSLRISLLIKEYVNLNFMAKATTGSFWKKASVLQKQRYKTALRQEIVETIEGHLNTLSTLNYVPIDAELRGKKLVYVRGRIEDPNNSKPPVNLLWKLASTNDASLQVLDLEIEGISLVSSHKAETMSILRKNKGDFEALIDQYNKNK